MPKPYRWGDSAPADVVAMRVRRTARDSRAIQMAMCEALTKSAEQVSASWEGVAAAASYIKQYEALQTARATVANPSLPITLPAGAVIYHDGRVFRLMHATQVEPYRPSSAAIHIFPPHRPIQPDAGGA